jgi:DNA-binding CsgD family transcriptional regulator
VTAPTDRPAHDGNNEGRIARTALAVLDRVRSDLVSSPYGVVIGDERARLIERSAAHDAGFGLGDVLALVVRGGEPVVDTVGDLAVAAAPIADPRSGRRVGAVALFGQAEAASELMLAYVRRISRDVEDGLVEDLSGADRALTAHFVRTRRHVRGAIACLNQRTMITNAAAVGLVDEADRPELWDWAQRAMSRGQTRAEQLRLSRGVMVTVRCEAVEAMGQTVGALVHLRMRSVEPAAERSPSKRNLRARREPFGWGSLSAAQLGTAELVAKGQTNREIAAQLYVSPYTVDSHLRQIFAKLNIDSRVELASMVSGRSAHDRMAS